MSEYTEVEKPFLQQLEALGWTAIAQRESERFTNSDICSENLCKLSIF